MSKLTLQTIEEASLPLMAEHEKVIDSVACASPEILKDLTKAFNENQALESITYLGIRCYVDPTVPANMLEMRNCHGRLLQGWFHAEEGSWVQMPQKYVDERNFARAN